MSEEATAMVIRGNPDRFVLSRPGLPDFEVVGAVFYDEMREARDHCKRQADDAGDRLQAVLRWLRENHPPVYAKVPQ